MNYPSTEIAPKVRADYNETLGSIGHLIFSSITKKEEKLLFFFFD